MTSTRQQDYKIEQAVASFMDEHFWNKIADLEHVNFERVKDRQRQYRWQDVVIVKKLAWHF